jgi:hypothetical protein
MLKAAARVLTPADLDGKFRINALDQGSTPLSDSLRKQNLLSLLPTLQGLGVDSRKMLEEIVRAYELPKDFLELAEQAAQAQAQAPSPSAADVANITGGGAETNLTDAEVLAQQLSGAR